MTHCENQILINNNYAVIICISKTFGKFEILIDIDDIPKIKKYYWGIKPDGNNKTKFYVQSTYKNKRIHLHRYILGLGSFDRSNCVDHINGNTLDNRKQNLRICTHKENLQNLKLNKRNKCGIKYISWCEPQQRWRVYIKGLYLGSFKTVEEAKLVLNKHLQKVA